jgi:hypothetical protein
MHPLDRVQDEPWRVSRADVEHLGERRALDFRLSMPRRAEDKGLYPCKALHISERVFRRRVPTSTKRRKSWAAAKTCSRV